MTMTMPLLSASLMMAAIGLVTWLVFHRVSVQSWRLRSWLVGAVLLQGLMVVRSPIHLGLIEPPTKTIESAASFQVALPNMASGSYASAAQGDSATMFMGQAETRTPFWHFAGEFNPFTALVVVWVTVAMTMIAIAGYRYIRVLRLVGQLKPAPDDWQRQWKSLSRRSRLTGAAGCEMLVSQSAGPMMVRRPTGYSLVVPSGYWQSLAVQQRRGVLLHELAHLQRRDVWRQLAARTIATIHWFNPMAWWALRQYELAAECACDHRVAADGKRAAAGFASALVELVQFHTVAPTEMTPRFDRGIGIQAMAAPPLNLRISRLLKPNSTGDSLMKRLVLALLAAALILVSFFQIRLTTAQEGPEDKSIDQLQVISDNVADQLRQIASNLDVADASTARLNSLLDSPSGKIAIAGYLNALRGQSRDEARSEAIPRFIEEHFTRNGDGKLIVKPDSAAAKERWASQAERLGESIRKMNAATTDIASRMDTSTQAGGLFKRLLQDPQATVAVLMNEMGGGDVISRYLSEALDRMLVDQGDGTFRIVESRRREVEKQIDRFEMADKISKRLKRELPTLAAEYSNHDEAHEKLIRYLTHPLTATVAAMEMSDDVSAVSEAVEKLHQHFENVSTDTAAGLKITDKEAWQHLREIYGRVDRAESILPRIREKLAEISQTLATDDPLTARMAVQMRCEPLAVLLASELPYAEADPGEELRALLSEVMTESNGKLSINSDRQEEVAEKARELLQVCRKIRRYVGDIDEMLGQLADRQFVDKLGDTGRYALLDEVRRFAEGHRPDPIALIREDLLTQTETGKLRVRQDRREIVGRLVEQSEKVRAEAANDDF